MLCATIPLLLALSWSAPRVDQTPVVTCPDRAHPDRCTQTMWPGATADIEGQLLSTELAVALGLKAHYCDERITLEVGRVEDRSRIGIDAINRVREVEKDVAQARLDAAKQALEMAGSQWWEHPVILIVGSVVLTGAATAGFYEIAIRRGESLAGVP